MSRWRLSTVRTFGGRDSRTRLYFTPRSSRTSRFTCAHTDAAPIAGLVEVPDARAAPSSPEKPRLSGSQDILSLQHATNTLECHYPPSVAPFRVSHSAIDILTRFLSSENVSSDQPVIYSPTALRSLYYRAESMNLLGMLDSKMLSLLIGLFGSLSIDPHMSIVHRTPLASRLSELSARRTHWAFVLKVGKYKLERGMTLQDSDRFWLMRAELAIVQAKSPSEPLPGDAYSAVLRARSHYHTIRRHSRCPEVHAFYLESLLAIRNPHLLDLAACDLTFLLRTHRVYHPRLQRLLYGLVIQYGSSLSTKSQESILAALWSRTGKIFDGFSDIVLGNGISSIAVDDVTWDATTLARSLTTTLFGFANHQTNESMGSLSYLLSVFSPVHELPLRWSSLVLFCNFNSSGILCFIGIQSTSGLAMSQVTTCWQVVFGLAVTEKRISQEKSAALTMPPTEEILETTRTLHQLWLPIMNSQPVSRDLRCTIATSFLGIAGVLANASLFHDLHDLYHVENSSECRRPATQRFLVARYIVAAMRVQSSTPDMVQTALKAFSPDVKEQHQALASVVEALAPMDASLAYTLYSSARGEMEPDPRASHSLAMSFARKGALRQAILLLNDVQLSPGKRGIVVSAMARSIRENPRARYLPSVLIAIVDELTALYRSHVPPGHFRGHLEQLVAFLAQHGRGSQLFPVILSIFRNSPKYFQPRFFVRYCRALVRHRQFVTASKLLDVIVAEHPKIAQSLRIFTDRVALQTKAFRSLKRTRPLRGPLSLQLSSRLRRWPQSGPPLERSLQELLISGRVLAAKRVFASAAATVPSKRCTTLGNMLLYGVSRQPTPRNGRRVRKVLALFEDLVENEGFRPDRVTANILIKVMIHWRSAFDSPRLRELFDQLVRSGYPAANYSPSHPPFGTRQTQFPGSSGISKLPSFASFEKHSRPLFKMFIKAFYSSNDVEAARKVVGILKVEEHKHAVAKRARQEARRGGRVKAAQRNVDPLASVPRID